MENDERKGSDGFPIAGPRNSRWLSSAEASRCRTLLEHSRDLIVLLQADGTVLHAFPPLTTLTGYADDAFVGHSILSFIHCTDAAAAWQALRYVVRHPKTGRRVAFRLRHLDGSWLPVVGIAVSRLADPMVGALVLTIRDDGERNRMEDELRRSRELLHASDERYRALVEQSTDAIIIAGPGGRLLDVNPAACRLTGYSLDELLRLTLADITSPNEPRTPLDPESVPGERWLRRRDGVDVPVTIRFTRLVDGRMQGTLRSMTVPGKADEHLRCLTLATEQSPASVIMTSTEGVIEYVNPAFTTMTGYQPDEVIGQTPRILRSGLTPSNEYERLWATITSGKIWRGELCNRRKDGRLYWHSASIAPIKNAEGRITNFVAVQQDITERIEAEAALREREARLRCLFESNIVGIGFCNASGVITEANDEYVRMTGYSRDDLIAGAVSFGSLTAPEHLAADRRALEQLASGTVGTPWEKELLRPDGQRVPVLVGLAPLTEHPDRGVIFQLDLTDRRILERQLQQAQKMEAVGRLAAGVAHDFNNILMAITGYGELLRTDLTPGHPGLQDVAEIRRAADRAADLTRQLLAFSRQQVLEPRVLDLNDLVRNVEKMLRRLVGEDVELVARLDAPIGTVRADPGQLEQVLVNLVVNSRDAMPEGGRLSIETRDVPVDAGFAREHPGLVPGPYVTVAVTDTGTGMDAATKARVFEPFFTTKEAGKGTGLGLATVYGIVKQSDGYIDLVSELGRGTTFTVYLRQVEETVEPPACRNAQLTTAPGTETILLAEDDFGVRKIVSETLGRAGYQVIPAANGTEALREAHRESGGIQLLVTDVVMPEMGGRDLAARLTAIRPGLPVLYMSGYTDDAILTRGMIDRGCAYLKKPFSPDVLLRKVRTMLDQPR